MNTAVQTANPINSGISLSGESLTTFKRAMKIAYYKTFRKNGLITENQFEILMKMQSNDEE